MTDSLFRQEVIDNQRERLLGEVILIQPLSYYLLTFVIATVICVAVLFLIWGSYARKETVPGYLVPDTGMIKVYPTRSGVFDAVHVQEGDLVQAGQLLATISATESQGAGDDTDALIITEIETQVAELTQRIERINASETIEKNRLDELIKGLETEISQLVLQAEIQKQRFEIFAQNQDKLKKLVESGHISRIDYQQQYSDYLLQKANLEAVKQEQTSKFNSLQQSKFQIAQLPLKTEERIAELQAQISTLNQRIAEYRGRRSYALRAPKNGKVVSLQINEGQTAIPRHPVMSLLPENASLEVHLLVPTRAIGFIEPGQQVHLQYDAFPYQRFGIQNGTVSQLSKAILSPNELPVPLQLNEAVYRVIVRLDRQSISAFGKEFSLKSGMLLRADILLESRSLLEWLFEPIVSLRGRL